MNLDMIDETIDKVFISSDKTKEWLTKVFKECVADTNFGVYIKDYKNFKGRA